MIQAVILIVGAFIAYTVGIWSEKIQGQLKWWHVLLFWCGLVFDVLGTIVMAILYRETASSTLQGLTSFFATHNDFHSLTGLFALVVMLLHAGWATIVVCNKKIEWVKKFQRYSLTVWVIWLIPFISGMLFHIR
ncbi:HsmA family protein [Sporomusa malonica]|uniref:TIGR03987 family protein n=1 Tax=Sporomusa malonica TaxID=112901 RepID=A0A1W1ZMS7_9FIRM|nr:HsmA family protein [Sporomusa malonica]SMC49860.1 TIGR03987 family protein [Sporomusa malonica]